MEGIWKDIDGYNRMYQISNIGRVKSLERRDSKGRFVKGRMLKLGKDSNGYPQAHLWKDGKQKCFLVHRLVAEAFIPNINGYAEINHVNEIKTDNNVANLEWCNKKYNNNYGTCIARSSEARSKPVLQYDKEGNFIKKYPSLRSVNKEGFHHSSVSLVCRGVNKQHNGYVWRYA